MNRVVRLYGAWKAVIKAGASGISRWITRQLDAWYVPEWQWVGQGDVLWRRCAVRSGLDFEGLLEVDRESFGRAVGRFGTEPRHGAIRCHDGRYFYPIEGMRISPEYLDDIKTYGISWVMYRLTVTARWGNVPMAETVVGAIQADLSTGMDRRVEQLFRVLLADLERRALRAQRIERETLGSLRVERHAL